MPRSRGIRPEAERHLEPQAAPALRLPQRCSLIGCRRGLGRCTRGRAGTPDGLATIAARHPALRRLAGPDCAPVARLRRAALCFIRPRHPALPFACPDRVPLRFSHTHALWQHTLQVARQSIPASRIAKFCGGHLRGRAGGLRSAISRKPVCLTRQIFAPGPSPAPSASLTRGASVGVAIAGCPQWCV